MRYAEHREAVAAAGRRLADEGFVLGSAGNVSLLVDDAVVVTPTGAVLAELEAKDVAVVDLAGSAVDGKLAPTSEIELHLALYARGDAGAVIHTHSPIATALACVEGLAEVPVIHYAMLELGGAIPVVPHETFGSTELANSVLGALADHRAALLANHGVICVADGVTETVERCRLVEWVCGLYWRASAVGEPAVLRADEVAELRDAVAHYAARSMRPAGG